MAQADINGTALEYSEVGSGEPLVLVHGSASDHRTWHLQVEPFAERFRVIHYSRRYHWPNEPIRDGADYSMQEQLDDLGALVRSLDAAPAHFVGHSYGALLCLLLAIREPSLVRTLALTEPPVMRLFVSNVPKPLELLKLFVTRPRTAAAIVRFGAKGVVPAIRAFERGDGEAAIRTFTDAVFGPGGYERIPERRRAQADDNLSTVEAELLGPGFLPLDAEDVRKVEAPTLLLTGERSIPLFHRLTDRLEELLPNARRMQISGATHLIHEDDPAAYADAVMSFIERQEHAG